MFGSWSAKSSGLRAAGRWWVVSSTCSLAGRKISGFREDPFNLLNPTFGHCPNSDWTPHPHSTGHSGALFSGHILPFRRVG